MKIESMFAIPVTVDVAWPILLDLQRVAPCFPGALVERMDGDEFSGKVKVKLGPIQLTYAGSGRFLERDDLARRAVIEAAGKDIRGAGTAAALITAHLIDVEGGTEVRITTDVDLTGKPAQFGRGVMQDVSAKLAAQFATNLSAQLAAASDAPGSDITTTSGSDPATSRHAPQASERDALDLMEIAGPALAKHAARAAALAAAPVCCCVALGVLIRRFRRRSRGV